MTVSVAELDAAYVLSRMTLKQEAEYMFRLACGWRLMAYINFSWDEKERQDNKVFIADKQDLQFYNQSLKKGTTV